MKKLFALLLAFALLTAAVSFAEAVPASQDLSFAEIRQWADSYKARALKAEPLNVPARSHTEDGYAFVYDFATLYADRSEMSEDTVILSVLVDCETEQCPRGVWIGAPAESLLAAYPSDNPLLDGSRDAALLYLHSDDDTVFAGTVLRDGQRLESIQHALYSESEDGYTNCGILFTLSQDRVTSICVYGLHDSLTEPEVQHIRTELEAMGRLTGCIRVPVSERGVDLLPFSEEDLALLGFNFLTVTPGEAITLLGAADADEAFEDAPGTTIRSLYYDGLTMIFSCSENDSRLMMLLISGEEGEQLEGPRGTRIGDSLTSVMQRFRFGEGEVDDNFREVLYGREGEGSWGLAEYGTDGGQVLRYGITLSDGTAIQLMYTFPLINAGEIMLFIE